MRIFALLLPILLLSCREEVDRDPFPELKRATAPINSGAFSTEEARERLGGAEAVLEFADISEGMTVADIGAGQGYYTIHLARAVGETGRVLAEEIVPDTRDQLAQRVQRERLDNVAVVLGLPDDPRLPVASFDRVLMAHVYHEVEQPYGLLWRIAGSMKPGGLLVVVESERPVRRHGIPFLLLTCELNALGFALDRKQALAGAESYVAVYRLDGARPAPEAIEPCDLELPED